MITFEVHLDLFVVFLLVSFFSSPLHFVSTNIANQNLLLSNEMKLTFSKTISYRSAFLFKLCIPMNNQAMKRKEENFY